MKHSGGGARISASTDEYSHEPLEKNYCMLRVLSLIESENSSKNAGVFET